MKKLLLLSMLMCSNVFAWEFNNAEIRTFSQCGETSNTLTNFTKFLIEKKAIKESEGKEVVKFSTRVFKNAKVILKDISSDRYDQYTKEIRDDFMCVYKEQGVKAVFDKYYKRLIACNIVLLSSLETFTGTK